jgi:hypothetical protein
VPLKQPLARRHENFKAKRKITRDDAFVLVCAVEAEKIKATQQGKTLNDKDALNALLGRVFNDQRKGAVAQAIRTKWQPRLTRARKELLLENDGFDWESVAQAWASR